MFKWEGERERGKKERKEQTRKKEQGKDGHKAFVNKEGKKG